MKGALYFIFFALPLITNAQIITTVAGTGSSGYNGDGIPATTAKLYQPGEVYIDSTGYIYIADCFNCRVRKVDDAGTIYTIAGNGSAGFSGDNGPATAAELSNGIGKIAKDFKGNLYIADGNNHRIRKVAAVTQIITTYAGNGSGTYAGDGGQATDASLFYPGHLAIDNAGNLYISDVDNYRIRRVDTFGIITTYAGTGALGSTGDGGPATAATFASTQGLACDAGGNLLVCDRNNGKVRVINAATKIITTIAGNGSSGFSGSGVAATATGMVPEGIAVDGFGNVYLADYHNNRVYKINSSGIINSIAGTGASGYNGDGILADTAELQYVYDVALDLCGNIFIADGNNERIRKINYPSTAQTLTLTTPISAAIGSTVTLSATITGGCCTHTDSVIWMDKGVVFATTATPTVNFTKTMSTDSISAIAIGCGDTAVSGVYVVTRNTTGLSGASENQNSFTYYPNPAFSQLYLSAGVDIESVIITDLLGHIVIQSSAVTGQTAKFDVNSLPTGVYFVKLNNRWVQRFIKE